jgi:hypothetical protein
MITDDDELMDEGRARRMMRDAILRELQSPADPDEPAPVNKLQQVVRALVSKAAREDVAAIKEILDRIDGKTPAGAGGADEGAGQGKREVNIQWKHPTSS